VVIVEGGHIATHPNAAAKAMWVHVKVPKMSTGPFSEVLLFTNFRRLEPAVREVWGSDMFVVSFLPCRRQVVARSDAAIPQHF
jgi:hypothetical protein